MTTATTRRIIATGPPRHDPRARRYAVQSASEGIHSEPFRMGCGYDGLHPR